MNIIELVSKYGPQLNQWLESKTRDRFKSLPNSFDKPSMEFKKDGQLVKLNKMDRQILENIFKSAPDNTFRVEDLHEETKNLYQLAKDKKRAKGLYDRARNALKELDSKTGIKKYFLTVSENPIHYKFDFVKFYADFPPAPPPITPITFIHSPPA